MCATRVEGIAMAEMMQRAALSTARRMGLTGGEQTLAALQKGDCLLCESVRDGVAREVAGYLGAMDAAVRAVYIYDPDRAASVDEAVSSPGINLIAWVERKSAALSSLLGLLGAGLAEQHERLACPHADGLCWALDVQLVDDGEVESRTGYGALIGSLYVRPTEIWRRS